MRNGRVVTPVKGYVCVFVYTNTVRIKIWNNLTIEAILSMLRRFIARRGILHEVFAYCGARFEVVEKF